MKYGKLCACWAARLLCCAPTNLCLLIPSEQLPVAFVILCSCSLSVNAEPFGTPPQPVALDLLHLPKGLTQLELRNIDITTSPAAFLAAGAAAADGHAFATGDSAGAPTVQQQPSGAAFAAVAGSAIGAASAVDAHAPQQQQQQQAVGMLPLPRMRGDAGAVLGQLACLKLESCRLRTRQLQVRLHRCCCCCCTCPSIIRPARRYVLCMFLLAVQGHHLSPTGTGHLDCSKLLPCTRIPVSTMQAHWCCAMCLLPDHLALARSCGTKPQRILCSHGSHT
jgi:hypothetical protein